MNEKKCFQIKTFFDVHNYGSHYKNKNATIKWVAERYLNNLKDNDYNIEFTLLSSHHAKRMALSILNGHHEQYKHTTEYCSTLSNY